MALKPTEYGGADTDLNSGIQPAPHGLTQDEQLRVMYATDPASLREPDPARVKKQQTWTDDSFRYPWNPANPPIPPEPWEG